MHCATLLFADLFVLFVCRSDPFYSYPCILLENSVFGSFSPLTLRHTIYLGVMFVRKQTFRDSLFLSSTQSHPCLPLTDTDLKRTLRMMARDAEVSSDDKAILVLQRVRPHATMLTIARGMKPNACAEIHDRD